MRVSCCDVRCGGLCEALVDPALPCWQNHPQPSGCYDCPIYMAARESFREVNPENLRFSSDDQKLSRVSFLGDEGVPDVLLHLEGRWRSDESVWDVTEGGSDA